ncbi:hypothetical protein J437_LFUL002222 [Ladona fulva]|uniref:Uncharacterized protein n=1 Tax=Ladona fulva TaxID=123851 RepID=A0A8K0NX13_LADFU|nr:hypothetical protein J437_LFUL002222 [Ladona fulva]
MTMAWLGTNNYLCGEMTSQHLSLKDCRLNQTRWRICSIHRLIFNEDPTPQVRNYHTKWLFPSSVARAGFRTFHSTSSSEEVTD